jgi:hypothetical protein
VSLSPGEPNLQLKKSNNNRKNGTYAQAEFWPDLQSLTLQKIFVVFSSFRKRLLGSLGQLEISKADSHRLRSRKPGTRKWGSAALTTRHPLYPQKLSITSPTSGGRSVGIVGSRTKTTEFILVFISFIFKVVIFLRS